MLVFLSSHPMLAHQPGEHCADFHPAHCTSNIFQVFSSVPCGERTTSDLPRSRATPLLMYCLFIKPQLGCLPKMQIFVSLRQKHWICFPSILPHPPCIHHEDAPLPPSSCSRWQLQHENKLWDSKCFSPAAGTAGLSRRWCFDELPALSIHPCHPTWKQLYDDKPIKWRSTKVQGDRRAC